MMVVLNGQLVDDNDDGDADDYGTDDVFPVSAGLNLPTMGLSATCPLASFTILHSGWGVNIG